MFCSVFGHHCVQSESRKENSFAALFVAFIIQPMHWKLGGVSVCEWGLPRWNWPSWGWKSGTTQNVGQSQLEKPKDVESSPGGCVLHSVGLKGWDHTDKSETQQDKAQKQLFSFNFELVQCHTYVQKQAKKISGPARSSIVVAAGSCQWKGMSFHWSVLPLVVSLDHQITVETDACPTKHEAGDGGSAWSKSLDALVFLVLSLTNVFFLLQ